MDRSVSTITREFQRNARFKYINNGKCLKPLMVCNKYKKRSYCTYIQTFYNYQEAENKADTRNKSAQNRTLLSLQVIQIIDDIVTLRIRNCKSLHHVYHANPELAYLCSERTIRRLIDRGELTVKSHELRRYVRFKRPQKRQVKIQFRDIEVLYGRQYEDFLKFVKRHKRMNIAQYDSVVGKRDDRQALLTIMFPKYNLEFGKLIKKDHPNAVKSKIQALFKKLVMLKLKKSFQLISLITDQSFLILTK